MDVESHRRAGMVWIRVVGCLLIVLACSCRGRKDGTAEAMRNYRIAKLDSSWVIDASAIYHLPDDFPNSQIKIGAEFAVPAESIRRDQEISGIIQDSELKIWVNGRLAELDFSKGIWVRRTSHRGLDWDVFLVAFNGVIDVSRSGGLLHLEMRYHQKGQEYALIPLEIGVEGGESIDKVGTRFVDRSEVESILPSEGSAFVSSDLIEFIK